MVFFTCGGCGENFKKPQVEKHLFQCRNAGTLSCMDCNKDFHGDEYKAHTKCITELEKYSEVGFRNAPNHNKGEKKQESWVEIVRATLDGKGPTLNPASRSLLHSLAKHDNVPRKKAKFLNFVDNISRYTDPNTRENVWNLLEQQWQVNKPQPPQRPNQATNGKAAAPVEKAQVEADVPKGVPELKEINYLSKREKKADRRKKQHKDEKKDKPNVDPTKENGVTPTDTEVEKVEKKKKKRKRGEEAEVVADEVEVDPQPQKKKKKGTIVDAPALDVTANGNGHIEEEIEDMNNVPPSARKKFDWKNAIHEILEKQADHEISLKKLQKKTFAEYYSVVGDSEGSKSKEKLISTLMKKIKGGAKFTIINDMVKLNC